MQKNAKEISQKTSVIQLPSIHQLPTVTIFPQTILPIIDTGRLPSIFLQNFTKDAQNQK